MRLSDVIRSLLVPVSPGTVTFLSFKMPAIVPHLVVPGHRSYQISEAFDVLRTPVTRRIWSEVMGTDPWVEGDRSFLELNSQNTIPKCTDQFPATMVSWEDAMVFCDRISKLIGLKCSLPTELQWEYVARDAVDDLFYWRSNDIDDDLTASSYSWYLRNGQRATRAYLQEVGKKIPTSTGVHDMIGLISEYVRDGVTLIDGGLQINNADLPIQATNWVGVGPVRLLRGGSFFNALANCSFLNRTPRATDDKEYSSGFRIVVSK